MNSITFIEYLELSKRLPSPYESFNKGIKEYIVQQMPEYTPELMHNTTSYEQTCKIKTVRFSLGHYYDKEHRQCVLWICHSKIVPY